MKSRVIYLFGGTFLALAGSAFFGSNLLDGGLTGRAIGSPAILEIIPIGRLRLKIKTGNVRHAGTDNSVYVQLNNRYADRFYLDNPGNDRERNRTNTWDLVIPGLHNVADITKLKIGKHGNDGWCIKSVELWLNDMSRPIYRGNRSSCYWIDGNDGHPSSVTISSRCLRGSRRCFDTVNNGWGFDLATELVEPTGISNRQIAQMVAGPVGDAIHYESVYWGRRYGSHYVDVRRKGGYGSKAVKVDLDLAYDMWGRDPWVDVDFEMHFSCNNGVLSSETRRLRTRHGGGGVLYWLGQAVRGIVWVATVSFVDIFPSPPMNAQNSQTSLGPLGCPTRLYIDYHGNLVFRGPWGQTRPD